MEISRIQIFHLSGKLINEMVPHVMQPSVDVFHDSSTVCSSKAYLIFPTNVYCYLSMRADICPLYYRDLWMDIYHRGSHVCYLAFLQVSWNFFRVDVVVIIQKYNHEAVKLKKKLFYSIVISGIISKKNCVPVTTTYMHYHPVVDMKYSNRIYK